MSTRLLSSPGKPHELCDDLESLWFVLLYESLHFVKHNKPNGIDMRSLFDSESKSTTHVGGLGKRDLYSSNGALMTRVLKFDSKPFTNLVRQIYRLFKSLHRYYVTQDDEEEPDGPVSQIVRKLENCGEIERLLKEALDSEEWPVSCDKAKDQYPPVRRLTHQQKETVASSYANRLLVPSGVSSGVKRGREEEGGPPVFNQAKRPKTALWEWVWSKCNSLVGG